MAGFRFGAASHAILAVNLNFSIDCLVKLFSSISMALLIITAWVGVPTVVCGMGVILLCPLTCVGMSGDEVEPGNGSSMLPSSSSELSSPFALSPSSSLMVYFPVNNRLWGPLQ